MPKTCLAYKQSWGLECLPQHFLTPASPLPRNYLTAPPAGTNSWRTRQALKTKPAQIFEDLVRVSYQSTEQVDLVRDCLRLCLQRRARRCAAAGYIWELET